MLVSGDWLIPRLNGLPFFHKPPLTHWLQAASMAVFGVSPWAARLPQIALAVLMLAGLHAAARRLADDALAARAAIILAASGGWLIGGQYVNHDLGVATWIATTIWCFALALQGERPRAGWAYAGFAASALGLLTKGLIGVALPGLVLLLWVGWTRRWRAAWRLPWLGGVLLSGLIAVPWFVLAGQRYPDMWGYLFGVQQFTRYTGSGFNNPQPVWFYPVALLLLLFPWAFWACYEALAQARKARPAIVSRVSGLVPLCWIWLGAIVLFFSIPRSKLIGYILPVLPPLAVLAALGWQRAMGGRRHAGRWFAGMAALAALLTAVLSVALPGIQRERLSGDVARVLACRASPGDTVLVLGGYPFELPFVAQTHQPLVVVQDWPLVRIEAGDSWRRELFEAGDFEPALAERLLRTPELLETAARQPGQWLVERVHDEPSPPVPPTWQPVTEGRGWRLYRSAPERPEPAQHKGLPGCHDQRGDQRRP
ncbi:glycosyltransferase family 39 protein [Ottowia testudinis]|uniref:Glycosyltransferase family 39 protein n=2 Tax=Ottowia testudinis TaxID=2816950 RepID=A0A975H4U8_9BURK|nr:glycosyltransferase family 39 protein [Ottowia testudinis]